MPGDELHFLGPDRAAHLIQTGETTSVEVVTASLAMVNQFNDSHKVFTRVHRDEAIAKAEELDRDRARGIWRGPLHGVPFAVKDLFDIAGFPNSGGTEHRKTVSPATTNADSVQAIIDAGGVLIGQLNLHEWAYGGTSRNPHFGDIVNSWGDNRIPGGSSGGSAVAVSMGMASFALGTDTGGSVRIPASLSGISSLKVTDGNISTRGVLPLSWTLDSVGPMARRIKDLRTAYSVLQRTGDNLGPQQPRRHRKLEGTRLGIDRGYYLDQGRCEPEMFRVFENALKMIQELGPEIVDVSVPALASASPAQHALLLAEASAAHSGPLRANRTLYGDDVQRYLALGDVISAQDYITALRFREKLWNQFRSVFAEVDFMVSPGTPHVASPIRQEEFTWPDDSVESLSEACGRFTFPSNLAGIPSSCQPCGLTTDGLPVGLQLIGEPHSELALLDLGEMLEARCKWAATPPIVRS